MSSHWKYKRKKSYVESRWMDVPYDGKIRIPHRALDCLIKDEKSVIFSVESIGWRRYATIVPESKFEEYQKKFGDRIVSTLPYSLPVVDGCVDTSSLTKGRYEESLYSVMYTLNSVEVWKTGECEEVGARHWNWLSDEERYQAISSLGL